MLSDGSKSKKRRHKRAIASVFFRFSHRDKDGNCLKNKQQSSIVEVMRNDIMNRQRMLIERYSFDNNGEGDSEENKEDNSNEFHSTTYIPYYDKIPKTEEALEEDEFELINEEDAYESSPHKEKSTTPKHEEHKSSTEIPMILPKSESFDRYMPM